MKHDYISLLQEWKELRELVNNCPEPITLVKNYFDKKPTVDFHIDPHDPSRWPEPWELIKENIFCEFAKILAIYYTLRLTTQFSNKSFGIYTIRDKKNHKEFSVLFVDNTCVTYQEFDINKKDLTNEHIVILSFKDMSLLDK